MQCYAVNHGPVAGNHRSTDGHQQIVHGMQHRVQVLLCQTYDILKKSKQCTTSFISFLNVLWFC